MAIIKPFKALRPRAELASAVACVPYDVINTKEAKALAAGNSHSFLRVTRSELELPDGADPYSDSVYERARENLQAFTSDSVLQEEPEESFYIYELRMNDHSQTGIVGCVSLAEFESGLIKIHEKTRPEKVEDRTRHMLGTSAHCEPVFLAYRSRDALNELVSNETKQAPLYDFKSQDGISHRLWRVREPKKLRALFLELPCTYIADGHHRVASTLECSKRLTKTGRSGENGEHGYFPAVLFPHDQLQILPYNRIVRSKPLQPDLFRALEPLYHIERQSAARPEKKGQCCMYWEKAWHRLTPRSQEKPADPVAALDVSILQTNVLTPIFGIGDPRTDKNIDFVGGMRGTAELERLVNNGEATCAFSMFPVSMDELFQIADAGETMAPKSTWFEPKLRSGLFVHRF